MLPPCMRSPGTEGLACCVSTHAGRELLEWSGHRRRRRTRYGSLCKGYCIHTMNCAPAEGQQLFVLHACVVCAGGEEATGPPIKDMAAEVSAHISKYCIFHVTRSDDGASHTSSSNRQWTISPQRRCTWQLVIDCALCVTCIDLRHYRACWTCMPAKRAR